MSDRGIAELESLLCGEKKSLEIATGSSLSFRDDVIDKLNELMINILPGCWLEGEFINKESSDYMLYELHITGAHKDSSFSSIKIFDFGNRVKLVRI